MKLTPAVIASRYADAKDRKATNFSGMSISHIEDVSSCVNLTKLDLSKNDLRHGDALSGLKYCKSLSWLNLSQNQLDDISFICELENLTVLNISYNLLTNIPLALEKLVNLKALIINNNQIRSLNGIKFPPSLNTLVLSKNNLEDLGESLLTLGNLEKLSLGHNRIRAWPLVKNCWELKELRLNNNRIFKIPQELDAIPLFLRILDLGHNAITSFSELEVLKSLRYLSNVTLTGNPFCQQLDSESVDIAERIIHLNDNIQIVNSRKLNVLPKEEKGRPMKRLKHIHKSK